MIKRIFAAIFAFAAVLGSVSAAETERKYNYKISFENTSDFVQLYGWASGKQQHEGYPEPPKPTATVVADGKYGSGYKITNPGFYCDQLYGVAWRMGLQTVITPQSGAASETFVDYMKDVSNVNFWIKAPYSEYLAGKTRDVRFQFETDLGTFTAIMKLENTGDWQYVQIPMSVFKKGTTSMEDVVYSITQYKAILFNLKNDQNYFGRKPEAPKLLEDGTYYCPTWENPWDEPIIVDELVFDRSNLFNQAVNRPSIGEEDDFTNSEIGEIYIDNKPVKFKVKSGNVIDIPMPAATERITENTLRAEGKSKTVANDFFADSVIYGSEQLKTGAECVFTPPEAFPGTGKITVTAANAEAVTEYTVNFYVREPIIPDEKSIVGIETEGQISAGKKNISVNIANEGKEEKNAAVIAVVYNKASGAVKSIGMCEKAVGAESSEAFEISVEIPQDGDCFVKLFTFDSAAQMNKLAETIVIGR